MAQDRDELHSLYELCVQKPEAVVRLIRAAHGEGATEPGSPASVLHEDFAGTGAVSRAWVKSDTAATAVATDMDGAPLRFGREQAAAEGIERSRIRWREADVAEPNDIEPQTRADAIFVGNFSIGELRTRAELMAYLRTAHGRLAPGGILVCDTYGGAAAFRAGLVHRAHTGRVPGERVLYTWEQRCIDPFTARVTNALHFRVERGGQIVAEHFDAFVYHWRLWSVPELRDAMLEAGFVSTRIISSLASDSTTAATPDPQPATDHHIVCVAAYA